MKAAIEGALLAIDASAELVKLCRSDDASDRRTFWSLAGKLLPREMAVESKYSLVDLLMAANDLEAEENKARLPTTAPRCLE